MPSVLHGNFLLGKSINSFSTFIMVFEGIAMLFLLMYVSLNKLRRRRDLQELSDLVALRTLVAPSLQLGATASGVQVTKSLSSLGHGV